MTPEYAVNYLIEMSADVSQVFLYNLSEGVVVAGKPAKDVGDLLQQLLDIEASLPKDASGSPPDGIEIATEQGQVFAVHGDQYALFALGSRSPVPALVLFDMRTVLDQLEKKESGE